MSTFSAAPQVQAVAEPLIAAYHKHLLDHEVRVEFVFRDKAQRKLGKEIWGTAQRITSLAAFLAGTEEQEEADAPFFVIVIAEPVWQILEPEQQQALVDHELAHCWAEEDFDEETGQSKGVKLSLLGHDIEEFGCIVERYGLWRRDVKQFAKVCAQHSLDFAGVD